MESLRDRPWFVVKMVILIVVGVLVVIGALDGLSIFRARSQLTNATKTAAAAGAVSYKANKDSTKACEAASASIASSAPSVTPGNHFCKVDSVAGTVTITLHEDASTILLGKVPFVRRLAVVNAKSSSSGA